MRLLDISTAVGEKKIDILRLFDNERLIKKTGIKYVHETNGTTVELAERAAVGLSENLKDINACLFVTQSPDDFLPANAIPLCDRLQINENVIAFDVNQGCSGFVQALCIIANLTNSYNKILLVTADRYRSKLDKNDRSTLAVFSDGASASLWEKDNSLKILFESHISDGSKRDWLYQGVCDPMGFRSLKMSGAEVWLFTQNKVVPEIKKAIEFCEETKAEVSGIYLHQASKVVVDGIIKMLPSKYKALVLSNYEKLGNTVSSTIPHLIADHPMNLNNKVVLMCGFGVGLSASTIVYGSF